MLNHDNRGHTMINPTFQGGNPFPDSYIDCSKRLDRSVEPFKPFKPYKSNQTQRDNSEDSKQKNRKKVERSSFSGEVSTQITEIKNNRTIKGGRRKRKDIASRSPLDVQTYPPKQNAKRTNGARYHWHWHWHWHWQQDIILRKTNKQMMMVVMAIGCHEYLSPSPPPPSPHFMLERKNVA